MSYDQAITELRQLLSDTSLHKKATKKSLLGKVDGENKSFNTYDKRILEDTLEVFVAGASVAFSLEDEVQGLITLNSAPEVNTEISANYYWQFWIDAELKNYLNKGAEAVSQWTSDIPDDAYLNIMGGLKLAGLMISASLATDSLIAYMINRRHSEEFNIEQDGNDDSGYSQMISALRLQSKSFWDRGIQARDDFYMRQGKRNAPAFGIKLGKVRQYGPKR